jgi:Uma2 family endonuclease
MAVNTPARAGRAERTEVEPPPAQINGKVARARRPERLRFPGSGQAVLAWLNSVTWTEKAYFALPESNHIVELANGKLVIPDMPTIHHQRVVRAAFRQFDTWNTQHKAGEVLFAPDPVRLKPELIREPDVMFYLEEHRDRLQEQQGGPPDLAVEVLSPSTRRTDLRDKFAEYAAAGVAEYWLIDPHRRWVELYALEGDRYRRVGRYTPGQAVASRLLSGFALSVADLFAAA